MSDYKQPYDYQQGGEANREIDPLGGHYYPGEEVIRERAIRNKYDWGIVGCVFWSAVVCFLFIIGGATVIWLFFRLVMMAFGK